MTRSKAWYAQGTLFLNPDRSWNRILICWSLVQRWHTCILHSCLLWCESEEGSGIWHFYHAFYLLLIFCIKLSFVFIRNQIITFIVRNEHVPHRIVFELYFNLFWSSSNFPSSTSLQIQAGVGAGVYLTTRETEEGHLWPINTQILITSTEIIAKGTTCTQGLSAFTKATNSLLNFRIQSPIIQISSTFFPTFSRGCKCL